MGIWVDGCRQTLWSLEALRLDVMMIISLRNLTGISTAPLVKFQSDCKRVNPYLAAALWVEALIYCKDAARFELQ